MRGLQCYTTEVHPPQVAIISCVYIILMLDIFNYGIHGIIRSHIDEGNNK